MNYQSDKFQVDRKLSEKDYEVRLLSITNILLNLLNNLIMSNEAHFGLNGLINK